MFRAPMRSRDDTVPAFAGVVRGLRRGLCGIGGRLPQPPTDLAAAVVATEREYGERTARRLARFAEVPVGAQVWTRDEHGTFHRGVLTGSWRYDVSPAAAEADLVQVRPCTWEAVPEREVPAEVAAAFGRGGRNFQRVTAL